MVHRNPDIAKLAGSYLFPEIHRRKLAFLQANPTAKLISLGIGDTSLPIPPASIQGFVEASQQLGDAATYTGYGAEKGHAILRERIAHKLFNGLVNADEVYVSDGAKCDLGRLQILFGRGVTIALQDPAYPVYVDSAVLGGITGGYSRTIAGYEGIRYLPCTPNNGFFPTLTDSSKADLLYFCSPNNPTGAVATREQLKSLVAYAKKHRSIIVFDSAYAPYIQDKTLPRSIYEIEGAREVAIEIGSFSKLAGFTGVRLGWTVIPQELTFDDGSSVKTDWDRVTTTIFNGASNIAQAGGAALLTDEGLAQVAEMINYYNSNARILKEAVLKAGWEAFGGDHAPYLWVRIPQMTSWQAFEWLLNDKHLLTTPGVGFGPSGEGFIRMSALGKRSDVLEAEFRIQNSE